LVPNEKLRDQFENLSCGRCEKHFGVFMFNEISIRGNSHLIKVGRLLIKLKGK